MSKDTRPLILRGGQVVTMNAKRAVIGADVRIANGYIDQVEPHIRPQPGDEVIDAREKWVIPGLIQVHTHLCQALFRGFADDLQLLDWLKERIWPMESGHTEDSLRASANIGLAEMQLLGTTSILDMGTVNHTDSLFQAVHEAGIRYWGGNCLMDRKGSSGPLFNPFKRALADVESLSKNWARSDSLVQYVLCPRFAVSCTEKMLEMCADLQSGRDLIIHTHASESREEIALIRARTGFNNVDYFAHLGMLNAKTVIVHGVHLTAAELRKMVQANVPLVHCPSSNLKLASGIAPIEHYRRAGLTIGFGSDGAPCNNSMDPFLEMRLAALLQKPRFGPEALSAEVAFEMATLGGARVLGRESELGSIEPGKLADVVIVDRAHPGVATVENPYSALVYSGSGRDVCDVIINGELIVRNKQNLRLEVAKVVETARSERRKLFTRVGLSA